MAPSRMVRDGKATLEKFVAQLSIEEMAIIIRGEGMSNPDYISLLSRNKDTPHV